jgi:hypothetical protein
LKLHDALKYVQVLTVEILAAVSEMPAVRYLGFQADWREVEAVGCQKSNFNIHKLADNPNIILLDVRGYGYGISPPLRVI